MKNFILLGALFLTLLSCATIKKKKKSEIRNLKEDWRITIGRMEER